MKRAGGLPTRPAAIAAAVIVLVGSGLVATPSARGGILPTLPLTWPVPWPTIPIPLPSVLLPLPPLPSLPSGLPTLPPILTTPLPTIEPPPLPSILPTASAQPSGVAATPAGSSVAGPSQPPGTAPVPGGLGGGPVSSTETLLPVSSAPPLPAEDPGVSSLGAIVVPAIVITGGLSLLAIILIQIAGGAAWLAVVGRVLGNRRLTRRRVARR